MSEPRHLGIVLGGRCRSLSVVGARGRRSSVALAVRERVRQLDNLPAASESSLGWDGAAMELLPTGRNYEHLHVRHSVALLLKLRAIYEKAGPVNSATVLRAVSLAFAQSQFRLTFYITASAKRSSSRGHALPTVPSTSLMT